MKVPVPLRLSFAVIFVGSIIGLFVILFNEVGLQQLMHLSDIGVWVTWWESGMLARILMFSSFFGLIAYTSCPAWYGKLVNLFSK